MRHWLLMLAVVGGVTGCDSLKKKAMEKAKEMAKAQAGAPETGGFFDDATQIPAKFGGAAGGAVHFLELTLYPKYVIAQIQDPNKKQNADQYELRGGEATREGPIKWMGKPPTADQLTNMCVDAATMDFSVVPKLVKDATTRLQFDGAHVSHIMFKRNLPFSKNAVWRVYVDGERQSGSAEYDQAGVYKKTY